MVRQHRRLASWGWSLALVVAACSSDVEQGGSGPSGGTAQNGAGGSGAGSNVDSGANSTTGVAGASGASGSSGNGAGASGASGNSGNGAGASGASGNSGNGAGASGSSGSSGHGGSAPLQEGGSGETDGRADAGRDGSSMIPPDGALVDRVMIIDAPSSGNCQGSLTGPPDYSGENSGVAAAGSDATQLEALVRANHWRTAAGLSPLNGQAMLQQAAAAHAHFMSINPAACYPGAHQEVMTSGATTCAEFTGTQPWDRMTTAGYKWVAAGEVIDSATTGTAAVDEWIWTVFHREPFLSAQFLEAGFGHEGKNSVMDFAAKTKATATRNVVFPLPGQTDVKVDFDGRYEGPMPLPPATKGFPSGTVISVTFTSAYTIVAHELYDGACQPVVHTAHTATDDANSGKEFFYMFADAPLAKATVYTASVSAMVGGAAWHQTWSFKTK